MKGLFFTEEQIKHQLNISKSILESIITINTKDENAISSLLSFVKNKTTNFVEELDMLLEDKKNTAQKVSPEMLNTIQAKIAEKGIESLSYSDLSILSKNQSNKDVATLTEIKEAIKDGIIVTASAKITNIIDPFVKTKIKSDFNELITYADKCKTMLQKNTSEYNLALSESVKYISGEGLINFKEIEHFDEVAFHQIYNETELYVNNANEKQPTEQEMLPVFEEEYENSIVLK